MINVSLFFLQVDFTAFYLQKSSILLLVESKEILMIQHQKILFLILKFLYFAFYIFVEITYTVVTYRVPVFSFYTSIVLHVVPCCSSHTWLRWGELQLFSSQTGLWQPGPVGHTVHTTASAPGNKPVHTHVHTYTRPHTHVNLKTGNRPKHCLLGSTGLREKLSTSSGGCSFFVCIFLRTS